LTIVVWPWIPMCWKLSYSRRYSFLSDGKESVFRKLPYLPECKMTFFPHEIWLLNMWGRLKSCLKRQTVWLWTGPCPVKRRPASPNHHVRYTLLCDFTRQRVVICCLCFGTTYQYHIQRSRNQKSERSTTGSSSSNFFKEAGYFGSRLCFCPPAKNHLTLCTLRLRYS
jgi:hypothetical protein